MRIQELAGAAVHHQVCALAQRERQVDGLGRCSATGHGVDGRSRSDHCEQAAQTHSGPVTGAMRACGHRAQTRQGRRRGRKEQHATQVRHVPRQQQPQSCHPEEHDHRCDQQKGQCPCEPAGVPTACEPEQQTHR